MLILAPIIGVSIHPLILPQFLFFMLLLAFAVSGLGLLIASLMKTMESFGLVMQLLVFPMLFVSGAFFPLTSVPGWMKIISRINPLTYGVDSFRQILLSPQVPKAILEKLVLHSLSANEKLVLHSLSTDLAYLLGFSILMISIAVSVFNRKN